MAKIIGYFLFAGYIALSWILDEFHPFSKYPMYNSFPNYSYAFYIADNKDRLLPLDKFFGVRANELSHLFVGVCEKNKFKNGHGLESSAELEIVGREMLNRVLKTVRGTIPTDSVSIHRVYWHIENNVIIKDDKQLCKIKVE